MATIAILFDFFPGAISYFNPSEECPLCFCTAPQKEYVRLSCDHKIHYSCLMRWKNSCPLCRIGTSEDKGIRRKFDIKDDLKEIKKTINKW